MKEHYQQGVKICQGNWYISSPHVRPSHTPYVVVIPRWFPPQRGLQVGGGFSRTPQETHFPGSLEQSLGPCSPLQPWVEDFELIRTFLPGHFAILPFIGVLSSLPQRKGFPSKQLESLSFGPEGSSHQSCRQACRALETDRLWTEMWWNFCLAVPGPHLAPSHSLLLLCWFIVRSFFSSHYNSIYCRNCYLFLALSGF